MAHIFGGPKFSTRVVGVPNFGTRVTGRPKCVTRVTGVPHVFSIISVQYTLCMVQYNCVTYLVHISGGPKFGTHFWWAKIWHTFLVWYTFFFHVAHIFQPMDRAYGFCAQQRTAAMAGQVLDNKWYFLDCFRSFAVINFWLKCAQIYQDYM